MADSSIVDGEPGDKLTRSNLKVEGVNVMLAKNYLHKNFTTFLEIILFVPVVVVNCYLHALPHRVARTAGGISGRMILVVGAWLVPGIAGYTGGKRRGRREALRGIRSLPLLPGTARIRPPLKKRQQGGVLQLSVHDAQEQLSRTTT